jgi:L-serine dehydratase
VISVFDLFKIGIGPSSSHTMGPMTAARVFASNLSSAGLLDMVCEVRVEFFGSLGATGRGHSSDRAVLLGLEGHSPETVDLDWAESLIAKVEQTGQLHLLGSHAVALRPRSDLIFHTRRSLPLHPNGLRFSALSEDGSDVAVRVYYSIGGGFVVDETGRQIDTVSESERSAPWAFATGRELLQHCASGERSISDVVMANEAARRPQFEVREGLLHIWRAMEACASRGLEASGVLPGGLNVPRRAPGLYRALMRQNTIVDPLQNMDWVNLVALSVNEENAAGGRVVTAPTNGAAGIIPAVLHYYMRCVDGADDDGVIRFLLTAGAIGMLFKANASISGAEVGCQGEVGTACAMAAGALCELLGGTPAQAENAAEIGIEHNLGLTCDPVGGLVQIPCIERNAMASVQAINAARIAIRGDGSHMVTLDTAIETMLSTGRDMKAKYKETSRGGLAVNVVEC